MPTYKNIICAVDLSPESRAIVDRAVHLCAPGSIHLLHVCEHPITGYGELSGNNHLISELQIREAAYPQLERLARQFSVADEHLHIEFGRPADVIHELAEQLNADLIVIGSHGKWGIKLLLGSTANAVLHGAKCDVLTVRVGESG